MNKCEICGDEFTPQRKDSKFCSTVCAKKAYNRKYRQVEAAMRATYTKPVYTYEVCGRQIGVGRLMTMITTGSLEAGTAILRSDGKDFIVAERLGRLKMVER